LLIRHQAGFEILLERQTLMITEKQTQGHTNPDPITGAPGSHPGATAIGTASGTATGAAIGVVGGPVGIVVGGVVGGIVGAALGHGIGEWHDPSDQDYWRREYPNSKYYDKSADFDQDVAPAYRYGSNMGLQAGSSRSTTSFDDTARKDWDSVKAKSKLTYEQARNAISDAYTRKQQPRQAISDSDNIAH
jgi:hypothetical protein